MPSSDPTLWQLAIDAAATHPDRVVLSDEHGRSLTTAQLCEVAEEVAAGLGIGPDDVVSWQLPTTLESAVLLLAIARAGAVQNPIISILREREVGQITAQIGTTVLIVPERWRGTEHGAMARAIGADNGCRVVVVDLEQIGSALRLPLGDPSTLPDPPSSAHDYRWVYFTSGTTAAPKGVRHSDSTLIASSFGMTECLIGDGDVYPIAWPLAHIGGITMLASVLRGGGQLSMFETFDPGTFGERVATVGPTILGTGVPFFRAYMDAQRRHGDGPLYPRLRAFTAGGAPTPPEVLRELAETFGIDAVINAYGMTEFPIASSLRLSDPEQRRAVSVGRPTPGVTARTVDGELRLKGQQCFLGYVDSSLDAAAFDEDGWMRTGDLAEIDDGFITITGRLKDVIIRNGENISAGEVEDVLLRHPAVLDVTVVGLPDARTGERVVAVVVPQDGVEIDLVSIAEHCKATGIARQKVPEQLEIVDAIPRNPMGKVLKDDVRATVLARGRGT